MGPLVELESIHNINPMDLESEGDDDDPDRNSTDAVINAACSLCQEEPIADASKFFICTCGFTCHIYCLAMEFLKSEGPLRLIPDHGTCPSCSRKYSWPEILLQIRVGRLIQRSVLTR